MSALINAESPTHNCEIHAANARWAVEGRLLLSGEFTSQPVAGVLSNARRRAARERTVVGDVQPVNALSSLFMVAELTDLSYIINPTLYPSSREQFFERDLHGLEIVFAACSRPRHFLQEMNLIVVLLDHCASPTSARADRVPYRTHRVLSDV